MIEIFHPETRESWLSLREPTIGASETPAILGVHPYMTPFQLWARKSRLVPRDMDNKQKRRGRILEPIAIDVLREERPEWAVTPNPIPGGKFYRDLEAGLSCTPDMFMSSNDDVTNGAFGTCNIKTVNPHTFQNDWMIDGEVCLPPYVAIQVIQEAYLTGASWACIAALVGFDLDMHIIDVKIHPGVIARIKREVPEFLRRVRENDPPDPDYASDGGVIADLYANDDGGCVDLSGNDRVLKLVARREAMKEIMGAASEADKVRKTIDSELIHLLGNATRGILTDGRIIEAKTVHRKGFTVTQTSYRSIKIKVSKKYAA
jgi:YqaJ-like viral recombinase domain